MYLILNRIIMMNALLFLFMFSCNPPGDPGSMQPSDGYPFIANKEEIKKMLEDRGVGNIKFKKGEIIADIGAGNGYIEAMLSIFNDSLTFYIQDIDTSVCNQRAIEEVIDFYQKVKSRPFTNKFIVVNGTDTETNLPDRTFDKILMLRTYPYLKEPRKFIMDVRENLKDDGLFYVINPQYDTYDNLNLQRQKYGWNASPLEKEITDIIDCGFELRRISREYDGYGQPYIMVFKKKTD